MSVEFWRLPGPAAFIASAADVLYESGVIVLVRPDQRKGIGPALVKELRRRDIGVVHELRRTSSGNRRPPAEFIASQILPPDAQPATPTPRALAEASVVEGEVAWIEGVDAVDWLEWDIFLRAFGRERECSRLRPPLALGLGVACGAAGDQAHRRIVVWRGAMTRLDTALYVAERLRMPSNTTIDPRLIAATIVEFAGWNLELADAMIAGGKEAWSAPVDWLLRDTAVRQIGEEREEFWDGNVFRCSRALARDRAIATLQHRHWRAQLGIVFPWLEEVRLELIERHRRVLTSFLSHVQESSQRGDFLRGVEDLEFGEMLYVLNRQGNECVNGVLDACRKVRNHLAHREPADITLLIRAFTAWARLLQSDPVRKE